MRIAKITTKRIWKVSGVALLTFLLFFLFVPLPSPLFNTPYTTTLRSNDGTLLSASIASDQQWRFPPSDSIPRKFKIALRLFEDEYFYQHLGINPISLVRASRQNYKAGKVISGGSTISMQTVRMAFGNKPRTYGQKIIEMAAATKLEFFKSKESIMKLHADHAPFGGNIVGISAASWRYYGRPAHQLSWAETATLAILPNDPASIFPGKNHQLFLQKRDRLLQKIHQRGFIDKDELFLAKEESLPTAIKPLPNQAYHLLHRSIRNGNSEVEVQTTLDARLQYAASKKVNSYSQKMSFNQIHNAAAIILKIESGNTLAYVGNSNNAGEHGRHVDIITSRRSPGSLLKPFLYAAALDEGLIMPKQLLPDVPIFYKGFAPKNFDKKYRGAVPADDALISSLNVPFVHLLIEYGYEKFHQKLLQMGFGSFDRPASHYGLSLILGGAETTLWELTGVYAGMVRALNNHGRRPYKLGYSIDDYHENTYLKSTDVDPVIKRKEVDGYLRVPSVRYALEAMRKVKRPSEEAGWNFFRSSRPISWKTGTSYGFRDGWAIGLNNDYLVGVWIGNADGEGRSGLTGVRTAAPLMFELFELLEGNSDFPESYGSLQKVCKESGMIASGQCLATDEIQVPEYMQGTLSCTFHRAIHLNKERTRQVNSSCYEVAQIKSDSWFVLPPVQAWYYKKFHPNYKKTPPYLDGCEQADTKRLFDLIYPNQFTKVQIPIEQGGKRGKVIFEVAHENNKAVVYWHLDEQYMGLTQGTHQKGIQTDIGTHVLTLVDDAGNELVQKFEVTN